MYLTFLLYLLTYYLLTIRKIALHVVVYDVHYTVVVVRLLLSNFIKLLFSLSLLYFVFCVT